jgi:hypothetical protein
MSFPEEESERETEGLGEFPNRPISLFVESLDDPEALVVGMALSRVFLPGMVHWPWRSCRS